MYYVRLQCVYNCPIRYLKKVQVREPLGEQLVSIGGARMIVNIGKQLGHRLLETVSGERLALEHFVEVSMRWFHICSKEGWSKCLHHFS